MVRAAVFGTCAFWILGCIGVSSDPRGRFELVTMVVTPAAGAPQTLTDAGSLQLGNLLECDTGAFNGRFDGCSTDDASAGVSILAYDWVGTGFVPSWDPQPVFFEIPAWDGPNHEWSGPIPLGNLSCVLRRDKQDPLVLVGDACDGPEGGPFDVVITMDR